MINIGFQSKCEISNHTRNLQKEVIHIFKFFGHIKDMKKGSDSRKGKKTLYFYFFGESYCSTGPLTSYLIYLFKA